MLRKLIKHEFRATARIMLPMYLVLLITAVGSNLAGREMLDSRFDALNVLGVLVVMAFGFAVFGALVMSFVLMIQRFYKNLLQDEGYLMFTLPVSVHQHIWAKVIVSAVWFIATVLAVIGASLIVAYQGGFLRQFFAFLDIFFKGFQKLKISEALNGTAVLAELAILMFLCLVAFSLQFYAALAAGHSQASHKMIWSVVCFFGFQFVLQFGGAMLMIGLDRLNIFDSLFFNWDPEPIVAIHVALLMSIGFTVLYGAIFYAVTVFCLKKHLNLE